MFHLVGYFSDVDQAAALLAIAAMNDQALFAQGNNVRVPKDINFLQGAALLTAASTLTSAQVNSPSLRSRNNYVFQPLVNADDFPTIPPISWQFDQPIPLEGGEQMTFLTNTDDAAAIEIQGFVWLSDGPLVPRRGAIFSVGFTTAITIVQGVWTNGPITLTQQIPDGDYELVGLRAVGTNLQAARLVFPGEAWRPGVPAQSNVSEDHNWFFRNGHLGVWGRFDSNNLPSMDAVGITDTTQQYIMDVIKIS